MQYLLSSEEYNELIHAKELAEEKVRTEMVAKANKVLESARAEVSRLLQRHDPQVGWTSPPALRETLEVLRTFFTGVKFDL